MGVIGAMAAQAAAHDVIAELRAENARLNAALENEAIVTRDLREAVKLLGEMANCCTYDTLGTICDNCRCERSKPHDPPHTTGEREVKS